MTNSLALFPRSLGTMLLTPHADLVLAFLYPAAFYPAAFLSIQLPFFLSSCLSVQLPVFLSSYTCLPSCLSYVALAAGITQLFPLLSTNT